MRGNTKFSIHLLTESSLCTLIIIIIIIIINIIITLSNKQYFIIKVKDVILDVHIFLPTHCLFCCK